MGVTGRGASTYIASDLRFGAKPSTVTSFNVVWPVVGAAGPPYFTNAKSSDFLQLASTNANDTASGSGMRAVTIIGVGLVNVNSPGLGFRRYAETIWLNGTNPVTSTYKYSAFLRMFGARGATNVGSIFAGYGTFTSGVPANKWGMIVADYGQTTQLTGALASSVQAHVHHYNFQMGKDGGGQNILGTFQFRTRQIIDPVGDGSWEFGPWRTRYIGSTISNIEYDFDADAFIVDGPCQIEVRVNGSGTGARASADVGFELHKWV